MRPVRAVCRGGVTPPAELTRAPPPPAAMTDAPQALDAPPMSLAPLSDALPQAAEFVLDVLSAAGRAPYGALGWTEINRLAARWLRPVAGVGPSDTSRLGHALVLEMAERGLIEAEVTTAADGRPMVERVLHPRIFGVHAGRQLAA